MVWLWVALAALAVVNAYMWRRILDLDEAFGDLYIKHQELLRPKT